MSSSPTPGTPPAGEEVFARVAWALRRADLNLQTAKERPLREVGVPGAHYAVLISLQTSPGLTGAELARLDHDANHQRRCSVMNVASGGVLRRRS